jgi:hypothetical protein
MIGIAAAAASASAAGFGGRLFIQRSTNSASTSGEIWPIMVCGEQQQQTQQLVMRELEVLARTTNSRDDSTKDDF